MKFTRRNDEAVSPVIGVILMVAITVILAAVIAAFVFGMAGNITKTKVVAATVQKPDGTHIVVTYQGGQDAASFSGANVSITDSLGAAVVAGTNGAVYSPATTNGFPGGQIASTVGSAVSCSYPNAPTFAGKTHVVVTGAFTDGTQQVILDNFV